MSSIKRKVLILSFSLFNYIYASEYTDLKNLDELYRNRNFKKAMLESEKFIKYYPSSNKLSEIRDKLAKLYFLNKKYDDAIKNFKILLQTERSNYKKEDYYYYLARSFAYKGDFKNSNYYKNLIQSSSLNRQTNFEIAKDFLSSGHNIEAVNIFEKIVIERDNIYINEAI